MSAIPIESLLKKVRSQLHDIGKETLTAVRNSFHRHDTDRQGVLESTEFNEALGTCGIFVTRQELSTLFRHFAAEGSELHVATGCPLTIDLFAFFDAVSGELGGDRLARADDVWRQISGGRAEVPLDEVVGLFQANKHPRVLTKQIFPEEATGRLSMALEEFMGMEGANMVTGDMWLRYVAELSATTPMTKDAFFQQILDCFDHSEGVAVDAARIEQFEIYLTDKIRQYSPFGSDGLRATLRKFFHQQDSQGNGGLSYDEFGEFLITIGMVLPDIEREALFAHLAAPCGGKRLGFDFLALRVETLNAGPGPTCYQAGVPPTSLVDKIRSHLLKHHPKGLQSLFLAFRHVDKEQRKWVTHPDFYSAMRICGLRLGSQEVDRLLNFFDASRTGKIPYTPFLLAIRGDVPEKRTKLLEAAWKSVAGANDSVDVDTLRAGYEPTFHPKVNNNHQTQEGKVEDMLEFMGEERLLGKVSRASFLEYFLDESASIPQDPYFERYINHAFRLQAAKGG